MNTEPTEQEVTTVQDSPTTVVTKTRRSVKPAVVTESPQKRFEKNKTVLRTYQFIWYIVGVIETILAFRFLLKIIGASTFSGFTQFIYGISLPFAVPFLGIVPVSISGSSVVEWPTLIAMVFFIILGYGIIELLKFIKPITPEQVETEVEKV